MSTLFNKPNVSYLCTAAPAGQEPLVHFVIDQKVSRPGWQKEADNNYNQVSKWLSGLSTRTGLDYAILSWGDPEAVCDYIAEKGIEVSECV